MRFLFRLAYSLWDYHFVEIRVRMVITLIVLLLIILGFIYGGDPDNTGDVTPWLN